MPTQSTSPNNQSYDEALAAARSDFDTLPALRTVMDPEAPPRLLEAFLIQFCAYGVGMTEPVDGWIRRAGARCREIGLEALGTALERHAEHEAGHHELMIADTRALVERWNRTNVPALDAESLLKRACPPGVLAYQDLHEEVIRSKHPYGQLAIELEIEQLSVTHGAPLLKHCGERCGREVLGSLTFVQDHVLLDQGHTEFNRRQLDAHLTEHPDHLPGLSEAGAAALRAYGGFLTDCLTTAEAFLEEADA